MEVQADIIPVVGHILTQMTVKNDKVPLLPSQVSIFHSRNPPPISVQEYLERIVRFSVCSNYCFIVALIYIDRIAEKDMLISSRNVHRLLITSLVLASKMYDDDFYQNKYYAQVGGLEVQELNELEVQFLKMLNFQLTVSSDIFEKYSYQLSKHARNTAVAQQQQAGSAPRSVTVAEKIGTAIALNQYLENAQTQPAQPAQPQRQPAQQSQPRPATQQQSIPLQHTQSVPQSKPQQPQKQQRFSLPMHLVYSQYAQQQYNQFMDIQQQNFYYGGQYAYTYPLYIPANGQYQYQEEVMSPPSACEAFILNELKSKRLSPRVVQRATELLYAEQQKYNTITPAMVRSVCERLAEEDKPISPSTLTRACAHVESLRLGFNNMSASPVGIFAHSRGY